MKSEAAVPENRSIPGAVSHVRHYDYLDGLRALLAGYVLLNHAVLTEYEFDSHGPRLLFNLAGYGRFAVAFFIVLSGFCLMLPVLKTGFRLSRGYGDFMQRRAVRILPPYYLAALLALFLIHFWIGNRTGTHWDQSLPVTFPGLLRHLLLVQNFFEDDTINHVFWSISLEFQIYFFFGLLLWSWRRVGPLRTTVLVVLFSAALEKGLEHYFHAAPHVEFLGLFAVGMLAARIGFEPAPAAGRSRNLPWGWIGAGALLLFLPYDHLHPEQIFSVLLFGVFAGSFLIVGALAPRGLLNRFLSFRPLAFVGTFSYSLYLVHAPLLQILWQYPFHALRFRPGWMYGALLLAGTPLILLASYLFYLVGERPFLRRKT